MRIARFTTGEDPAYGLVEGAGEKLAELTGDPLYQKIELTGATHLVADVRLLAPVIPRSKVIGIGRNYADHAAEMGGDRAGRAADVPRAQHRRRRPGRPGRHAIARAREIHYEGELAVVIGRICQGRRARGRALKVVLRLHRAPTTSRHATCSSRDGQWARAKGFDTFCPLGPWIETDLDAGDLRDR